MSAGGVSTESVEKLWIEPRYLAVTDANTERFSGLHQIGAPSHSHVSKTPAAPTRT